MPTGMRVMRHQDCFCHLFLWQSTLLSIQHNLQKLYFTMAKGVRGTALWDTRRTTGVFNWRPVGQIRPRSNFEWPKRHTYSILINIRVGIKVRLTLLCIIYVLLLPHSMVLCINSICTYDRVICDYNILFQNIVLCCGDGQQSDIKPVTSNIVTLGIGQYQEGNSTCLYQWKEEKTWNKYRPKHFLFMSRFLRRKTSGPACQAFRRSSLCGFNVSCGGGKKPWNALETLCYSAKLRLLMFGFIYSYNIHFI